jgi:hypothetical protein
VLLFNVFSRSVNQLPLIHKVKRAKERKEKKKRGGIES